jgi:hypothetical protein
MKSKKIKKKKTETTDLARQGSKQKELIRPRLKLQGGIISAQGGERSS